MSYQEEYQRWLDSPALSTVEWEELKAIENNPKEIESRFFEAEGPEACKKGVVVCYDCRINSEVFAHEAAAVMAANGIHVRVFDALRPTPELSYAVLHYGAQAGINVTASHNLQGLLGRRRAAAPAACRGGRRLYAEAQHLQGRQAHEL